MMPYIRTKLLLHPNLLALAWFAAIAFIVSCGVNAEPTLRPTPVLPIPPTATPEIHPLVNPIWNVPPSVDEQILTSDVIIRASLLSATAETETVSNGARVASTYRPLQKLRFTAHEYLKGSGPAQAIVIVRGEHTYISETEAQDAADIALARRNTSWMDAKEFYSCETLFRRKHRTVRHPVPRGKRRRKPLNSLCPTPRFNRNGIIPSTPSAGPGCLLKMRPASADNR